MVAGRRDETDTIISGCHRCNEDVPIIRVLHNLKLVALSYGIPRDALTSVAYNLTTLLFCRISRVKLNKLMLKFCTSVTSAIRLLDSQPPQRHLEPDN